MFPFDVFEQAFQGNDVAWACIVVSVVAVAMVFFNLFLWWKMPQLAKALFINNTIGGQKPTMAQCYENRRVKFFNPEVLRAGFAIMKNAIYIFPKMWAGADELTPSERDLFNAAYTIDGTQSQFYVNYSVQAGVMNPGLVAMIEHEKLMQKLKKDDPVLVDKQELIDIINLCPEEKIQIAPLNFSFPISDIRNLKTWLPKSLSKSNFAEYEYKIRQDERGQKDGVNMTTILVILVVIQIIIGGVTCAKMFGLF